MRIGIMGAMPEEVKDIRADKNFSFILFRTVGGTEYYRYLNPRTRDEIYLVFSGWGKVAASSVATILINEFNVERIIFTGVAGAVHDDLKIGDVVIANDLIQHDMDCSPLGFIKRFEIPLLRKQLFDTDEAFRILAEKAVNRTLASVEFQSLFQKLLMHRGVGLSPQHPPKIKMGTMATGDQFIASKQVAKALIAEIKSATGGAEVMSVDMESAAVGQVCFNYKIPLTVIRIMSDEANGHAPVNFPAFADELAAPFNELIIRNFLQNMP